MPKIILKFNAAILKELEIGEGPISVGRKPDNDIVIDNPAVSGHHCKIIKAGEEFVVEDLESTNGTYVNNMRVVKSALKHNDIVGLATKHALVFFDEKAAPPPPPEPEEKRKPSTEPTFVLTPEKQKEIMQGSQASAGLGKAAANVGVIQILKGMVDDKASHELTGLSTYIGKSDRVQIQIRGSGFFSKAPEVAASIHRKPEGYFLLAVKDGYPVVNGSKISGQVLLKDGDIIECGATTMQFFAKKPATAESGAPAAGGSSSKT